MKSGRKTWRLSSSTCAISVPHSEEVEIGVASSEVLKSRNALEHLKSWSKVFVLRNHFYRIPTVFKMNINVSTGYRVYIFSVWIYRTSSFLFYRNEFPGEHFDVNISMCELITLSTWMYFVYSFMCMPLP